MLFIILVVVFIVHAIFWVVTLSIVVALAKLILNTLFG